MFPDNSTLAILHTLVSIAYLYIYIRISLSIGFVLDKEISPWNAIKLSFKATANHFWRLIAILILVNIIVLASSIPAGLGLIWTLPLAVICYGMIYKRLQ
jgi:uncharacterized membrane protein